MRAQAVQNGSGVRFQLPIADCRCALAVAIGIAIANQALSRRARAFDSLVVITRVGRAEPSKRKSEIGNCAMSYPASLRSLLVADFSKHSREQYSDSFDLGPMARSAGIHVPQATQRTS